MGESIDLTRAPGQPRPDDLICGVLEGTGLLPYAPIENRRMETWTWVFHVPHRRWVKEIRPVIQPRIQALYDEGVILYGSW